MNIKILAEKFDKIKNTLINIFTTIKENKNNIMDFFQTMIIYIAFFIIIGFLAFVEIQNTEIFITIAILISVFLLFNKFIDISNIYINYLREKEEFKYLDLNLVGNNINGLIDNGNTIQKSISQVLDDHIEDILNSNILFFMNIPEKEYIRANTEQEILNSLIDNVMKFTSNSFKKKLSLYYGSQNIDLLIGRRCLIIVSLFVANHNKNIYISTPNMN